MSTSKKFVAILAAISTTLLFSTTGHASPQIDQEKKPLDECISKQRKLSVLFLVDESVSLTKNKNDPKGTDPKNLRVTALQAAAVALASLTKGEKQDRIEIEASIAGFGDGYSKHIEWTSLDTNSISKFSKELAKQANRNKYFHTRYNEAMKGAVASFNEATSSGDTCRLLIWFSDGQHDHDDSRGLSKLEKRQISKDLCGSGGYVDQLRENGVFIQAVGLNASSEAMDLMRIIAVRDGSFSSNGLSLSNCGSQSGNGKFTWVSEADGLIDALISGENVRPNKCADGTPECSEFVFNVDETVSRFRFLVTKPPTGVTSTVVTAGQGDSFELFKAAEANPIDVVTSTTLTSTKILLDVLREKGESISGEWKIRFLGPNASEAVGKVSFIGDTVVRVSDGESKPLKAIDRFKTSGLVAKLSKISSGSRVQAVEFTFKYLKNEQVLVAQSIGSNEFKLEKIDVMQIFSKTGQFASIGSVDVSALPLGYVLGLKDENNKDVSISYRPTLLPDIQITDGDQQPIVKSVLGADGMKLKFEGTTKKTAFFTFSGADAADTKVVFSSAEQNLTTNPKKFSVIKHDECIVPRGQEKTCQVEIKPQIKGYGSYDVPLSISYVNSSGTKKISQVASVMMKTDPDRWAGIVRAIKLLGLFLIIQGSLRAGFAVLMTRFAKLNGSSRRGRIPVAIDQTGRITPSGSAQFSVVDDGYAIENQESVRGFKVFGVQFSCSPMRTFLRSTVTPIGQAEESGSFVFGSSGYRIVGNTSVGLVNLGLRNQWVLRISNNEIVKLANGANSVPGEVVAFFDPVDLKPIEGQVQSLGTSLVSSAVPASIKNVVDEIKKNKETLKTSNLETSPTQQPISPTVSKNPFGDTVTDSNSPVVISTADSEKKQKKQKKQDSTPVPESRPRNPFAN
jgi:hypothetical protein